MRFAALAVLVLFAGALAAQPAPPIPGLLDLPETAEAVAFVGVTVVPMDAERVIEDQTVIVRDGRIEWMGARETVAVPEGATIVDGVGRYLMPGLAEMHAHIPPPSQGEGALERTLFLFLANGVTTIRGMLGHEAHLALQAERERLVPRVVTSSPSLNGNTAPAPEDGRRLVAEHAEAGFPFFKIHPGLSRETYDAVVEAASARGLTWAGHVPAAVGLDRALEAGQVTIDHLDAYVEALAGYGGGFSPEQAGFFGVLMTDEADAARIPELAAATRAAGVWNVPTQSLMEHLLSPEDPEVMVAWLEMRYVPEAARAQWVQTKHAIREQAGSPERAARFLALRRELVGALHREGAELLLGADAPQVFNVPGFSAHRELAFMVEAGLSPFEALATGTTAPARFFGVEDRGAVAEGAVADLVLLGANPLGDVAHAARPIGVMVRGHWLDAAEIERRLALVEAAL